MERGHNTDTEGEMKWKKADCKMATERGAFDMYECETEGLVAESDLPPVPAGCVGVVWSDGCVWCCF